MISLEVPPTAFVSGNLTHQMPESLLENSELQPPPIHLISDAKANKQNCYCLNSSCYVENPLQAEQCLACGSSLKLHDRYRILHFLAKGRFGATLLAIDENLPGQPYCIIKRLYAMTVVPKLWEAERNFFQREANALSRIGSHPQIPRLLEYFSSDRDFFLVQEIVNGLTLEQVVKQNGVFTEIQVKQFLQDFLPILQYVHSHQIIHRDIKPANIIRRVEDGRWVLIGLGASRDVSKPSEHTTAVSKALCEISGYVSPEQQALRPTFSSDIFSLGMTCIYLLTGRHPKNFDCDPSTGEMQWQKLVQISPNFAQILDKMVDISCRHRYRSTDEVARVLDLGCDPVDSLSNDSDEVSSSQGLVRTAIALREWRAKMRYRQKMSDPLYLEQRDKPTEGNLDQH